MSSDDKLIRYWSYIQVHELWSTDQHSGMGTYYILVADFDREPDVRRVVADTISLIALAGLDMNSIVGHVFIDVLLKAIAVGHDNMTISTTLVDAPEPHPEPVVLTLLPNTGVCIEYGDQMWEPEMFNLRYGTEIT